MKLDGVTLRLSATDLANHLACRHLTGLDRGAAEGLWKPPEWFRPDDTVLVTAGASAPEDVVQACLDHLRERYGAVIEERTIREEDVHFPLPLELRVV